MIVPLPLTAIATVELTHLVNVRLTLSVRTRYC